MASRALAQSLATVLVLELVDPVLRIRFITSTASLSTRTAFFFGTDPELRTLI
jgi:hypothetical protein